MTNHNCGWLSESAQIWRRAKGARRQAPSDGRPLGAHTAASAGEQGPASGRGNAPSLPHVPAKALFFLSFLRRLIPLRMKRTRHQLAPLMARQEIVDRTVACRMPDFLLVGNF